jgi:DNA-binding SARP family transcriptional activator
MGQRIDRTANMSREEERPATRSSHPADGVVLVDAERRVLWWSTGMEAVLEQAGRRWTRGMRCCEAFGCTDVCLAQRALDDQSDEPQIWQLGGVSPMAVRGRTVRPGAEPLAILELRFVRAGAGDGLDAQRDVRVAALGRLSVTVGEHSRNGDWMQQRPGQVLRYLLASRGGSQRSEAIANALWPERGPSAVANVRYCIFKLREHLADRGEAGSSLIVRDAAGYRIDIARVELDVDEFQAKSTGGIAAYRRGEAGIAEGMLGEALALYRGEFLADDPYADWAFAEREYLRSLAGKGLAALAQIALTSGRLVAAGEQLQRLAELEPFDSHVHQMLIEVCLRRGRRTEALRHYHALRARLHRAFGEQPDFELTSVAARAYRQQAPRARTQRLDTAILDAR